MPHLQTVTSVPLRHDAWSTDNAHCLSRYQILAEAEPDTICRVMNLFAMQYLTPQQVSVLQQDDLLMIQVEVGGMTWHRAQVIGEKMRNLINVCTVDLEAMTGLSSFTQAPSLAVGEAS